MVSQPKIRASSRSILLPAPVLKVLEQCQQSVSSRWMFPSPKKEDSPLDPAAVRKKLAALIREMKAELAAAKEHGKSDGLAG